MIIRQDDLYTKDNRLNNVRKKNNSLRAFLFVANILLIIGFNYESIYKEIFLSHSIYDSHFNEVIEQGLDEDNTVLKIVKIRDKLINYANYNDYLVIESIENCNKERKSRPLLATYKTTIKNDDIEFRICLTLSKGELLSSKLSFESYDITDIKLLEEHGEAIKYFSEILSFDEGLEIFTDTLSMLKSSNEQKMKYYVDNRFLVYCSKELSENNYYYCISFD